MLLALGIRGWWFHSQWGGCWTHAWIVQWCPVSVDIPGWCLGNMSFQGWDWGRVTSLEAALYISFLTSRWRVRHLHMHWPCLWGWISWLWWCVVLHAFIFWQACWWHLSSLWFSGCLALKEVSYIQHIWDGYQDEEFSHEFRWYSWMV